MLPAIAGSGGEGATAVLFCPRKSFIGAMFAAGPLRILVHEPVSHLAENHREGYKMTWTFGDRLGKVDLLPGGLHAARCRTCERRRAFPEADPSLDRKIPPAEPVQLGKTLEQKGREYRAACAAPFFVGPPSGPRMRLVFRAKSLVAAAPRCEPGGEPGRGLNAGSQLQELEEGDRTPATAALCHAPARTSDRPDVLPAARQPPPPSRGRAAGTAGPRT